MKIMQRERLTDPRFRVSLICAVVLALFALAIGVIVLSTLELTKATTVLGPGFYPLLVSILMFLSCLYVIYSLLFGDSKGLVIKSALDGDILKRPLALLVLAVVSVAMMPLLGFLGSMFLFNFIQSTYMEKEKQPVLWRLIYSAAISGGVYWLFKALMIYLPVPFWL